MHFFDPKYHFAIYSYFDKGCPSKGKSVRDNTDQYYREQLRFTLFQVRGSMNSCVSAVSFFHAETPLASIKQQLSTITHNTFRQCRVRLYAVGQPFTKRLYTASVTALSLKISVVLSHKSSLIKMFNVNVAVSLKQTNHLKNLKKAIKFPHISFKVVNISSDTHRHIPEC